MMKAIPLATVVMVLVASTAAGQQVPDLKYAPKIVTPAYETGKGPRVVIDEAHHNFHTADDRYKPFAELLRRDGYRVDKHDKSFTAESLKEAAVLVIANPLHERNAKDWSLPTPSAFTKPEIAAVKAWVEKGGSLFLIADHMPFPGAAGDLARAFDITFSNGYAQPGHRPADKPSPDVFVRDTGLKDSAVTRGRNDAEKVTKIATFGGSAFQVPKGATPVIVFGAKSVSHETTKAPGITPDAKVVPIDGWCQGAILKAGEGRIAVFGEAAMFSAQRSGAAERPMGMNAPDAAQNHQLLLNVLHWLSRVKGLE